MESEAALLLEDVEPMLTASAAAPLMLLGELVVSGGGGDGAVEGGGGLRNTRNSASRNSESPSTVHSVSHKTFGSCRYPANKHTLPFNQVVVLFNQCGKSSSGMVCQNK